MSIITVGTSHKYSPIAVREKLSFTQKSLRGALCGLLGLSNIRGAVVLSTCNRVELYVSTPDADTGIIALKRFLAACHSQEPADIEPYLYTYIGKQAARHLFYVASGLDSQVIGEEQILGQVKSAYLQAKQVEATDRALDSLFTQAIKTSLKVRQDTGISGGKVSLASIALELLKKEYGNLKDKRILIIGVGKISAATAKYLKAEEAKTVFIANRTFEKAVELAKYLDASVVRFDELKERLGDTDIVISATSSPHLILRKEDLALVKKPLFIIDLAVPRDVEPGIRNISGIRLFDLDGLSSIIQENLNRRIQDVPLAKEIIEKEVENLCRIEFLESEPAAACLP